jgi:hypothetical protein
MARMRIGTASHPQNRVGGSFGSQLGATGSNVSVSYAGVQLSPQ